MAVLDLNTLKTNQLAGKSLTVLASFCFHFVFFVGSLLLSSFLLPYVSYARSLVSYAPMRKEKNNNSTGNVTSIKMHNITLGLLS